MSDKEFEYLLKNEGNIWEKYIKGEVELESGEIKLLTKAEPWVIFVKDSLCEDYDIIESIADTANRALYEKYKIKIDSWPMSTAVFLKTFESICAMLKSKEQNYSEYAINFMNRFVISFNSNLNDEDEKNGNFMIYLRHIGGETVKDTFIDPTDTPLTRVADWNKDNLISKIDDGGIMKKQPELTRKMSLLAVDYINKINIKLANNEVIFPMFINFYDSIITVCKLVRKDRDLPKLEVNLGLLRVVVKEGPDGRDIIELKPDIAGKLNIKDDKLASSASE